MARSGTLSPVTASYLALCFPHPPSSAPQNNKDYFDQGLDEVKLLRYVNAADPGDESGLLRLHDFFYFKASCWLCSQENQTQLTRLWQPTGCFSLLPISSSPTTHSHQCPLIHPRFANFLTKFFCCLQEHLVLVTELLRANLYEFQK